MNDGGGFAGWLAVGADVVRPGKAHDARGVLACAIPTSEFDQGGLDRRPLIWWDRLTEYPVAVSGFTASGDDDGGLPEA